MRNLTILFVFLGSTLWASEVSANTHTNANVIPNNGNKEAVESGNKENNGKYTFTLFNFFATQAQPATDSTAVKKEVEQGQPVKKD